MELLSSVFSWFSGDRHSQQQKEILREKNKDRNINCFHWSFLVTFQKNNFKWKQRSRNRKFGERAYFPYYFWVSTSKAWCGDSKLILVLHTSISCKFNGQTPSPVTPMQNGIHLQVQLWGKGSLDTGLL